MTRVHERVRPVPGAGSPTTGADAAEGRLAEALEMAGLGCWGWEGDVGFTASARTARILGRDPETWVASPEAAEDAVHPDDLAALVDGLRTALARGGDWEARHRIVHPDGEVRHVHSRARVEIGADGGLLRIGGTVLDVTAEARQQAEVESHNQRLSDTMAMLGHDVRQPLTVVLGFLEEASLALRTGDAHDADPAATVATLRDCIDRAGRAGTRLRGLLDDILAVGSVDSGTLVARPECVPVGDLLAEVVEEIGVAASVTGGAGAVVHADRFHLRQALTNLLVNATKYGQPPFALSVHGDGERVEIAVEDHGDGVPEEFVPDLFGRFSRGERHARGNVASAGLGLYLVRCLVEVNHGTVRYAGVRGEGARFLVSLPVA